MERGHSVKYNRHIATVLQTQIVRMHTALASVKLMSCNTENRDGTGHLEGVTLHSCQRLGAPGALGARAHGRIHSWSRIQYRQKYSATTWSLVNSFGYLKAYFIKTPEYTTSVIL